MNTLVKKSSQVPAFGTFFDDFFSKDLFNWNDKNFADFGNTLPSVNVKETETNYEIEMAVPGLKKEDFKINIDRNILTISSESQTENEERDEKKNYTRREFNYQSFTRSFTMPSDIVDVEHIEAKYDNGILKLAVPKRENAKKEVKTIEIK